MSGGMIPNPSWGVQHRIEKLPTEAPLAQTFACYKCLVENPHFTPTTPLQIVMVNGTSLCLIHASRTITV